MNGGDDNDQMAAAAAAIKSAYSNAIMTRDEEF